MASTFLTELPALDQLHSLLDDFMLLFISNHLKNRIPNKHLSL